MRSSIKVGALAVTLAACGGGIGAVDGGAGGDSAGGVDASAATLDSGGGGDERLLPLAVGRTWTYEVTTMGGFPVCTAGTHTETVLREVEVAGRTAFEVRSFCPAAGDNVFAVDGDKVELRYGDAWIVVLDVPVEEGHGWTSTGPVHYTWHEEPPVTVPAGTFSDCWRREQDVAYTAFTVFCRGVGMVRDYSEDLQGSGWDARLSARE